MGLRTRALSLVLAFGMMLSILPPSPGAFAADNASSTPIEMSDVMSLGHDGDNAKYGYPIGSGTIGHCVFKSKTDYPASNTITNSAFLNNKQNFDGMHTIKMADGETNTKLFAILYGCNSGYGVSGLDTIGFVGSPSLYIAGTTSYGSSRTLASVNGKAIGADDIPGVTTAQTKDPPASVLYATSNGFALTPDGTSDITLSQVVAPAPNPSPDGKLYLDENGVPVYTSGDGWSYEPRTLYDYQGARLTAISVEEFFQNLSITGSVSIMNDTDGKYYFTMPDSAVTIQTSSSTDPSEPSEPSEPAGPGGESDGAGVAGAVVAVTAIGAVSYAVVTRVWLESILPEGSSIPTSRQQLADLLWIAAGRPEPVSKVLYPDISAAEVDHQKAALWYVEQGLLKDNGEVFRPNDHTFRPQVIKAWNQLQDALNAAQ